MTTSTKPLHEERIEEPAKARGKPCVCGHLKGWHRKSGCMAKRADATPGDIYCRCRWFVHALSEGNRA